MRRTYASPRSLGKWVAGESSFTLGGRACDRITVDSEGNTLDWVVSQPLVMVALTIPLLRCLHLGWDDSSKSSQSIIVLPAVAAPIAIAMTVPFWASVFSSRSIANIPVEQPQMMSVAATQPGWGWLEAVRSRDGLAIAAEPFNGVARMRRHDLLPADRRDERECNRGNSSAWVGCHPNLLASLPLRAESSFGYLLP